MAARELEVLCAEKGLTYANEQKHLGPACKLVTALLARRYTSPPDLSPFDFGDRLGWVGLGNVDVVFRWPDRRPMFVELKCGSDLTACVWDAVKLSSGVLHGNAALGIPSRGAPTSAWLKPTTGAELRRCEVADGRAEYPSHLPKAVVEVAGRGRRRWSEPTPSGARCRGVPDGRTWLLSADNCGQCMGATPRTRAAARQHVGCLEMRVQS